MLSSPVDRLEASGQTGVSVWNPALLPTHAADLREVGRFTPSEVIVLLIARHFNVPVEEIFSLEDES